MELFEIMIVASAFTLLYDLYNVRSKNETTFLNGRIPIIVVSTGLVIISYLWFAYSFLTSNYKLIEVFQYSSSILGWSEKLYASWASNGGSWLFFAFSFALGYLVIRLMLGEKEEQSKMYQYMNVVLIFMVVVIIIQNPFAMLSYTPSEGLGLNPLLKTPWMLIHPPIVFVGYVTALYALGFTFSESDNKPRLTRGMAAIAWLFLTLGIAIGGLWAYEVLGWGGYWAWDPVETSSLVPWLTLTAYFHLVSRLTSKKSTSQDFMLMVTGALIIFATAVTRGGLAQSVHAFGSNPIGYLLLVMMGVIIVYYLGNKSKRGFSYFEFELKTDTVYDMAISMSFLSIVMIAVVSLWGIVFPIINSGVTGGDVSIDAAFFNKWTYPFVLLFLVSLIGCNLYEVLDIKKYSATVFGVVILGVVGAVMKYPTGNMLANLGIPMAFVAGIATVYHLITSIQKKRKLQISRSFLHFGVVIIMIGILFSATNEVNYGELVGTPGETMNLGELQLDFGDFERIEPTGLVQSSPSSPDLVPEFAGLSIPVTVRKGGETISADAKILLYSAHGIVARPTVLRSLGWDVYIVIHQSQNVYRALAHGLDGVEYIPVEFVVSIIYFPWMNLIWIGTLIICIGVLYPITFMRKPSSS
ncbi:cytochrome c biogenesis protein CcsA [Candidatus Bathyarchaeota archaeon]|nr:cytochrome c biogenesis protein CcsA [Candidatus Bathyarchaeota archaeon]